MALTDRSIRNVAIYAVPRFVGYALNLLALPIFTRILSPKDFGVIALAWLFPTVATTLLSLGLNFGTQRYYFVYRTDEERLATLLRTTQIWLVAALGAAMPLIFLTKGVIARLTTGSEIYGTAVFVAFIAASADEVCAYYLQLYQNMERARTHSTYVVSRTALTVTAELCFVALFHLSYLGMLLGNLVGGVTVALVMAVNFNRGRRGDFSLATLKQTLAYGVQVIPKSFTGLISRFFDKYMLNNIVSLAAVGAYNIGQTVANTVSVMMNVVWTSFQPAFYREMFDRGEDASDTVGRMFTVFAFLGLAPAVALAIFAEPVFLLLAPPAYANAVDASILVTVAMSTQVFGMFAGLPYAYSKRAYLIFPISVVGTVANVAANLLLVPRLGIPGAALSMIVMYVVLNGLLTWIGQRQYRVDYEWRWLVPLFGTVVAAAAAGLWAHNGGPLVAAWAAKLAAGSVFLLVGWRAGILTRAQMRRAFGAVTGGAGDQPVGS
jgi:O-antigen/teichoic acid export membrane protein